MRRTWPSLAAALGLAVVVLAGARPDRPAGDDPAQSAERMIAASRGRLTPVYAPLAEQMAKDLKLAGRKGIGIDLGSGPGTLIVELCRHSDLHWVNADINPHFFPHFIRLAEVNGFGHRVSAMFADAKDLPFRDNYADVIVSRGSYPFWGDRKKGFQEAYRVLKAGGVAYIGRGLPRELPIATAKAIRSGQGKAIQYDRQAEAEELRKIMKELDIQDFHVHTPPAPDGSDVNYGVWVEFRKPAAAKQP